MAECYCNTIDSTLVVEQLTTILMRNNTVGAVSHCTESSPEIDHIRANQYGTT